MTSEIKIQNLSEIQYRDRLVLFVLYAFKIATIRDLAVLTGFNNYKYAAKKFSYLESLNLIGSDYIDKKKVLYLKAKGNRLISKKSVSYKLTFSSRHDVGVATIATWIYLTSKEKVSYEDFWTDKQLKYVMRNNSDVHRPDLVLGEVAYEFERTHKDNRRLANNIKANRHYQKQIWVVEDEYLGKRIKKLAEENIVRNVEVIMFDTIADYVNTADISENRMRDKAVLGEKKKDILFKNNNPIYEKYFGERRWSDV